MNPWMRARGIYSFAQHPFIKAQRRNSRRSKCQHQSCSLSCRPWNLIMDCFYPCTKGETAVMCWKKRAVYLWTTVRVKQAAPRLLHCFFLTGQSWPSRVCLLVRGSCCMTQAVWALDHLHSVLGLQVWTTNLNISPRFNMFLSYLLDKLLQTVLMNSCICLFIYVSMIHINRNMNIKETWDVDGAIDFVIL